MTDQLDDIKSLFEEVKEIGESLEAKKLESILKKHPEDPKNVRRPVSVMMSAVTMEQMVEKLLKCGRADVIEAVYCLKKQFNEKMNNNSLLYENYENKLKKKRARERHFREEIARLEKQILGLQKLIVEDPSIDVKSTLGVNPTLEGATKRTMKIPDSLMFSDGKTMSITQ